MCLADDEFDLLILITQKTIAADTASADVDDVGYAVDLFDTTIHLDVVVEALTIGTVNHDSAIAYQVDECEKNECDDRGACALRSAETVEISDEPVHVEPEDDRRDGEDRQLRMHERENRDRVMHINRHKRPPDIDYQVYGDHGQDYFEDGHE